MHRRAALWLWVAAIPALLTGESAREQAWKILLNAAVDTNPVRRTQALTALGTIGPTVPAMKAIEKGLQNMAAASVVRLTCEPARHHSPAPPKTQEH